MDPEALISRQKVRLQAFTIPVTNRRQKHGDTARGNPNMRVDWTTIDRVVEWIRSRLYELCLPTERTHVLFKYTIDDPVRTHIPMTNPKDRAVEFSASSEIDFDGRDPGGDDVSREMAQRERAYLTGRLWDQRFQGNRFVILDQGLIHDSQDRPIDLNQSKKEFSVEKQRLREHIRKGTQEQHFNLNA